MDKNQFTGLILMFALLAVYFIWFAPDPPPIVEESTPESEMIVETDSVQSQTSDPEVTEVSNEVPDSLLAAANYLRYGEFAFAADPTEKLEVVETEDLIVTFTNVGGRIKEVSLKNHKDFKGNIFKLMSEEKSITRLLVEHQSKKVNLSELGFSTAVSSIGDTTQVAFKVSNGNLTIEKTYYLPKSGFEIGFDITSNGLNKVLDPADITFQWIHSVNRAEYTLEDSRYNSNVRYYLTNDDYDELAERSFDFEEETLSNTVKWVSFKQKFFSSAIIANTAFNSGYVNQKVNYADSSTVKDMSMELTIPYSEFLSGFKGKYYFGTNKYSTLKKIAPEFEENLDMGWGPLPIVNKFLIIPIFNLLQGFMSNYGLIIIVIVIFIRLILSPLTYKSHMSMAKMRVMKPELDELKEKHEGDMQKQQQEQMKLYQQVGINPLSGCIPILLQMPILFSLFFFFPNSVELRGKSFLWAHDLSTYDSILNLPFTIPFYGDHVSLFTLLMTITTVLTIMTSGQASNVQGPMKTVQYIMPVMMLFFLNNYASGLTFYYFISNMTTLGQNLLFRKFIDEDKIHRILQENKKKNANKKKSKFQTRLEEAMKANQAAQQNKKKKR